MNIFITMFTNIWTLLLMNILTVTGEKERKFSNLLSGLPQDKWRENCTFSTTCRLLSRIKQIHSITSKNQSRKRFHQAPIEVDETPKRNRRVKLTVRRNKANVWGKRIYKNVKYKGRVHLIDVFLCTWNYIGGTTDLSKLDPLHLTLKFMIELLH